MAARLLTCSKKRKLGGKESSHKGNIPEPPSFPYKIVVNGRGTPKALIKDYWDPKGKVQWNIRLKRTQRRTEAEKVLDCNLHYDDSYCIIMFN